MWWTLRIGRQSTQLNNLSFTTRFSNLLLLQGVLRSVLRILIRIHVIHMFLGLLDPNPDPLFRGMDPRIRIHTKMSWIRNTAYEFVYPTPPPTHASGLVYGVTVLKNNFSCNSFVTRKTTAILNANLENLAESHKNLAF
jgi:hypothetical protein